MKILTLLLLLLSYPVFAQQTDKEENVIIRINNVDYDSKKIYFNPKNVKDFRKEQNVKDTLIAIHHYKKILLEQKKKSPILSISSMINQVRENNKIPDTEAISVIIDGKLLINLEEYYIEERFIKELTIVTSPPEERNDHKYHGTSIIIKTKKNQ
ncbi:MAG: hypothetical protein ACOVRN_17730 [Flavobacterium sp.]